MKKFLVCLLVAVAAIGAGAQNVSPDFERAMYKLLASINFEHKIDNMLTQIKENLHNVAPQYDSQFENAIGVMKNEIYPIAIKAYSKHYTTAEINELVAYNNSPLGKRFKAVEDQINGEVAQMTQLMFSDPAEFDRRLVPVSNEYQVAVNEYFISQNIDKMLDQTFEQYRQNGVNIPQANIDLMKRKFPAMFSSICSKYLSIEDVRGITAQANTALGQKFVTTSPIIQQEISQELMPVVMRALGL